MPCVVQGRAPVVIASQLAGGAYKGTSNNLLRKPDRLLRCSAYSPYASAPQIRCGPLATVIRSSHKTYPSIDEAFEAKKAQ